MLYRLPALLIALVIHEYAHAKVADSLGDPTARLQGRLTLNPAAHIDLMGILFLWLFRFGWAKPVPVNPWRLRNRRRGMVYVALAGPGANLALGLVLAILFRLPMPKTLSSLVALSAFYNVAFAVFNLIPVPPLDGSKVLQGLLPPQYLDWYHQLEPHGWLILVVLLVSGAAGQIILPAVFAILDVYARVAFLLIR